MKGQLTDEERRGVYDTVMELKPKLAVECGTWYGGGSTLAIARALAEIGEGVLCTYEIDRECRVTAFETMRHEHPQAWQRTEFIHGDFIEHMRAWRSKLADGYITVHDRVPIDFAMIDGPEDPHYTMHCVDEVRPLMRLDDGRVGTFIFHDWNRRKCDFIRSWIRTDRRMRVVQEWPAGPTGMARVEVSI